MSRHPKADLYRTDRGNGMTLREIAEKYGVSKQAVAQACGSHNVSFFKKFDEERCVYPNLRKWLNENKVSVKEFLRRSGLTSSGTISKRYAMYFRGQVYPTKLVIDKMLAVTGLTYEELFYREEDSNGR